MGLAPDAQAERKRNPGTAVCPKRRPQIKKDFYFEPKGTIKTAYYNSLNGGAKPDWRTEFRKLDMEARDSIVYKFISKEEKI